jgi:hypothetical protein
MYEVVIGGHQKGVSCFVIREVGVNNPRGWIAGSWNLSAADEKAVRDLVAQANGVKLDLADRIDEALKPWEVPDGTPGAI